MTDPTDLRRSLEACADEFAIPVPGEPARTHLLTHLQELYRWNRRVNLTAIRDPEEGMRRHLLESLFAIPALRRIRSTDPNLVLVDLGSGNGYPAFPLLHAEPELQGVLLESSARKIDFLRAVASKTGCRDRVQLVEARLTSPDQLPDAARIATVRAFPDPASWIPRLAERVPHVLAWLSQEDASRLASNERLRDRCALQPLPTHPSGCLLIVTR